MRDANLLKRDGDAVSGSPVPLFRPRFRWVPGRVDPVPVIDFGGGAPWVLHHSPLVHEVVPAAVPGHSCPAGCHKIAEIEGFLDWQARTRP